MPEIGRREKCEHFESDNKVTHQRILKRNVEKAVIVCRNGKQKWRWKKRILERMV